MRRRHLSNDLHNGHANIRGQSIPRQSKLLIQSPKIRFEEENMKKSEEVNKHEPDPVGFVSQERNQREFILSAVENIGKF